MIRRILFGLPGLVLAALWLASCAPELQFVTPDYANKSIRQVSLSVVRLDPLRLRMGNRDDLEDDLGNSSIATFLSFFEYELKNELTRLGTFNAVWFDTLANVTLKHKALRMTDKADMMTALPESGQPMTMDSAQSDFTLLIPYLDVSRFGGTAPTMVMGPKGSSTMVGGESAALEFNCEYVIWDNKKGAVVAYGQLTLRQPFFLAMTAGTWSDAVTNLARALVTKSPFRNPAPRYKTVKP